MLNNEGQLGWLPTNPRQWTKSDIDLTAQSLTNDPDFLEDRPLLVVPGPTAKSFIVFAGNLRLTAARQLKIKEVPGIIYTPENETDQLTIKRRSVLDNGSFGAWDYDALANEWDDLPLGDWGVPAWNNGEFELDALSIDPVAGVGNSDTGETAITFVFKTEEAEQINAYCKENGKDILTAKIVELCQTAEAK